MLDVSHWQELPAAAFSPSGVGGGQITQDRTPPSSICPGLARSSEVSTKQLYHFLGPSEVRVKGLRRGWEVSRMTTKISILLTRILSGVEDSKGITGLHC